jgi:hypothetical protein
MSADHVKFHRPLPKCGFDLPSELAFELDVLFGGHKINVPSISQITLPFGNGNLPSLPEARPPALAGKCVALASAAG